MFLKNAIERIESRFLLIQTNSTQQYHVCIDNIAPAVQEIKSFLYSSPDVLTYFKLSFFDTKLQKMATTLRTLSIALELSTLLYAAEDLNDFTADSLYLNDSFIHYPFSSVPETFRLLVLHKLSIQLHNPHIDNAMLLNLIFNLQAEYQIDFSSLSHYHQLEESSLEFTRDIYITPLTRILIATSVTHGSIAVKYHNIPILEASAITLLERIERVKQLSHPCLHQIFQVSYSDYDPIPFYTSVSCPNLDANLFLSRIQFSDNIMEFKIIIETGLGLQYMHQHGLSHGKIQASHIFITQNGCAQLGNYAISNRFEDHYPWMSPERLCSDIHTTGFQDDIYAFAITCGEVFSKRVPYASCAFESRDALADFVVQGGRPDQDFEEAVPGLLWHSGIVSWWSYDPLLRGDITRVLADINVVLNLLYYSNYDSCVPAHHSTHPIIDEPVVYDEDDQVPAMVIHNATTSLKQSESNWDLRRTQTHYTRKTHHSTESDLSEFMPLDSFAPQTFHGRTFTIKPKQMARQPTYLRGEVVDGDGGHMLGVSGHETRLSHFFDPTCLYGKSDGVDKGESVMDTGMMKRYVGGVGISLVDVDQLSALSMESDKPIIIYIIEEIKENELAFHTDISNFLSYFQPGLLAITSPKTVALIFDVFCELETFSRELYEELEKLLDVHWHGRASTEFVEPEHIALHKIVNAFSEIYTKQASKFELFAHYALGHIQRVSEYNKIVAMHQYLPLLKANKNRLRNLDLQHLITSPIQHITRYAHLRIPRLLKQVEKNGDLYAKLKGVSNFMSEISGIVENMQKQVENLQTSMHLSNKVKGCPNLGRSYNRILVNHFIAKNEADEWKVYLFTDVILLICKEVCLYALDIANVRIPMIMDTQTSKNYSMVAITVMKDKNIAIKLQMLTSDANLFIRKVRKLKGNEVSYRMDKQQIGLFVIQEKYIAQNDFHSRAILELNVVKGDEILLIKKFDKSGWAFGMNKKTSKKGAFPLFCLVVVEELSDDPTATSVGSYSSTQDTADPDLNASTFSVDFLVTTKTENFYILEYDLKTFMAYCRKNDASNEEGWLPINFLTGWYKITNSKLIQDSKFNAIKTSKNSMIFIEKIFHMHRATGKLGESIVTVIDINAIDAIIYTGGKKTDWKKKQLFELSGYI